jgi:HEAT repeat protein
LIGQIVPPGEPQFKSYRAEYLLHCLAIHLGQPGKEAQRKEFAETLASQLQNRQLAEQVRVLLVRELQVAGGPEAIKALGGALADPALADCAAPALAAIGQGAAEQLRKALPSSAGKARLAIIQNLGVLRDAKAAPLLRKAVEDPDREVRLAALWALAQAGDAGSADLLLSKTETAAGYERGKAAQACFVLAENLLAAGNRKAAVRIYTMFRDKRREPAERYLRDAADKALQQLGAAAGG